MPDTEKDKYMKQLKRRMEAWREIILPINSVILWEKSWYPGLILGATSTLFLMIWLLDPTFVTMFSLSLLFTALVDYSVPLITSAFISPSTWTGQKEKKLEEICSNLCEIIMQVQSVWKYIVGARNSRPSLYYGGVTLVLGLIAWVGTLVNNLLLMYLFVNVVLLLPGLKHKGGIQSAIKHLYSSMMHQKEA